MKKIIALLICIGFYSDTAHAVFGWRDKDQFWAGIGVGFPVRYDEDKSSGQANLSGPSDEFPVVSLHYFLQYSPVKITEHAFTGLEFGGLLAPIRRKDDRNEKIRTLYLGAFIDIQKFLEIKAGLNSTDFEFRSPGADRGLYFGVAYNLWRGDGIRMQLDYKLLNVDKTEREGEYATIMINLAVAYRKFIN